MDSTQIISADSAVLIDLVDLSFNELRPFASKAFVAYEQFLANNKSFLTPLQARGWTDIRRTWALNDAESLAFHSFRLKLVERTWDLVDLTLTSAGHPHAGYAEACGSDSPRSDIDCTFVPCTQPALKVTFLACMLFERIISDACGASADKLLDTHCFVPHGGMLSPIGTEQSPEASRLELDAINLRAVRELGTRSVSRYIDHLADGTLKAAFKASMHSVCEFEKDYSAPSKKDLVKLCDRIDALSEQGGLLRARLHLKLSSSFPEAYYAQGTCNLVLERLGGQKSQRHLQAHWTQETQRRRNSLPSLSEAQTRTGRKGSLDAMLDIVGRTFGIRISSSDPAEQPAPLHLPESERHAPSQRDCAYGMLENLISYIGAWDRKQNDLAAIDNAIMHSKYAERALLAARNLTLSSPQLSNSYLADLNGLLSHYSALECAKRQRQITAEAAGKILFADLSDKIPTKKHALLDSVLQQALEAASTLGRFGVHGSMGMQHPEDRYVLLFGQLSGKLKEQFPELKLEIREPLRTSQECPDALPTCNMETISSSLQALCGLSVEEYHLAPVIERGRQHTIELLRDQIQELNERLEGLLCSIFHSAIEHEVISCPSSEEHSLFDTPNNTEC